MDLEFEYKPDPYHKANQAFDDYEKLLEKHEKEDIQGASVGVGILLGGTILLSPWVPILALITIPIIVVISIVLVFQRLLLGRRHRANHRRRERIDNSGGSWVMSPGHVHIPVKRPRISNSRSKRVTRRTS